MNRVKIFEDVSTESLENEINRFIERYGCTMLNVKISSVFNPVYNTVYHIAVVLYR